MKGHKEVRSVIRPYPGRVVSIAAMQISLYHVCTSSSKVHCACGGLVAVEFCVKHNGPCFQLGETGWHSDRDREVEAEMAEGFL